MPHLGMPEVCKGCGVAHRPNVSCPAKGQSVEEFNKIYGIGLVKESVGPGQPQVKRVELHSDAMGFCMIHLCWHQMGQSCTK
jgi:hypothetical protein